MDNINNVFITGGAGFIGSNVTDKMLALGKNVTVYDNFSTGKKCFLEHALKNEKFSLIEGDVLDIELLKKSLANHDFVFHFSANADIRYGLEHPKKDLEQNTIATFNVLESMRKNNITKIAFSSTGSVYGNTSVIPTPENAPFPIQTSLYGSSKLAGETLISSYCEGYNFKSWIFRFVGVLGERYTHGHLYDFYKKLKKNPLEINVLGNGKQRKSYIYIQDCIDSMICAIEKSTNIINIYNLGCDEYIEVDDSVKIISNFLNLNPSITHSGGSQGWIGDNPFIYLDTKKIRKLGWKEKNTIEEGIIKTIKWIDENQWIYNNDFKK
tara:strand:+ start:14107 stop:15081 length:975 start_codon:yes stop_codon:yes gene_type:complete